MSSVKCGILVSRSIAVKRVHLICKTTRSNKQTMELLTEWIFLFLNSVQRGILVSRSIAVERVPSIGKTTFCLEAILTSHLTMSDWRWGHQIMPIFYYFRCFTQCKVVLYLNGWSFNIFISAFEPRHSVPVLICSKMLQSNQITTDLVMNSLLTKYREVLKVFK